MNFRRLKIILFIYFFGIYFCKETSAQISFQTTIGDNGDYVGRSVIQLDDEGYVITGNYDDRNRTGTSLYLIRTDSLSDTLWTRIFNNSSYGNSVQQTFDKNLIVSGFSSDSSNFNLFLLKIKLNGDTIWTRFYKGGSAPIIKQTSDSGFVILSSTNIFGAGDYDIYLIRTDSNGNILWSKTYGGLNSDLGYSLVVTNDNGFIIVGSTESFGSGGKDVLLIKIDSSSNIIWSKTIGGLNNDIGNSVVQANDSSFIIFGSTQSFSSGNLYLIKIDISGNLIWSKTFGTNDIYGASDIINTSDGNFLLLGRANSLLNINESGDTIWTRQMHITNDDFATAVKETKDGGFIITGAADVIAWRISIYLIKTDKNGISGCNESAYSAIINSVSSVITNPTLIVSTGGMESTHQFVYINSVPRWNYPICLFLSQNDLVGTQPILVSPNPFENEIFVNGLNDKGEIIIYDISGKEILHQQVNHTEIKINTTNFKNGFYFIKYINKKENKNINYKLLKL